MSDFFGAPLDWMCEILRVIEKCPQHTFMILTKRHGGLSMFNHVCGWPEELDNIWIGVSVENQARADERIPVLLDTPAAVRFVSCEPLLGPIDLDPYIECPCCTYGDTAPPRTLPCLCGELIDWVIVGGESGPNARPMHPDWARSIRDQCQAASVPFFFKQWGEWVPCCMVEDETQHPQKMLEGTIMSRVGKKVAGKLLDGRTWDEYPKTRR